MIENEIIDHLNSEISFLLKEGLSNSDEDLWTSRAGPALRKFVNQSGKIEVEELRNFRRNHIFINEFPEV
jgi:hypothetical protein